MTAAIAEQVKKPAAEILFWEAVLGLVAVQVSRAEQIYLNPGIPQKKGHRTTVT